MGHRWMISDSEVDALSVSCRHGHGSLDQDAVLEPSSGADERDQVGSSDGAPAARGRLDELEDHCEGSRAARTAGDLGAELDRGERRLDGVRGPQVDPMLGRVVVERQ